MKWPDHDEPPACSRLHTWLNNQDAAAHRSHKNSSEEIQAYLEAASRSLREARRPLVWLESTDVQTTRAAVKLAEVTGASLHVAQSPGAELVSAINQSDGWLGTTLAEVGSTASLVIHLGHQHLRDAPMFALRFAHPNAQHLFLDRRPEADAVEQDAQDDWLELQWTKEMWLEGLTRTLLVLRDESVALNRPANTIDVAAGMLAELLLTSHYSVIVWSEDELADELDSLIVRRLLELARLVNQTARCSLLCLTQDPGRTTAKDAVLWLTNHTTPVRYADNCWTKENLVPHSLEEWQNTFDWILCIRNLPSDRPLPELKFNLILDAHCNHTHAPSSASANKLSDCDRSCLLVSAVGLDTSGHLMRSDHGLAAMIDQVDSGPSAFPHAANVLSQFADQLLNVNRSLSRSEAI